MFSYYLKCKKDTKNVDPKVFKTKNGRITLSPKCVVCSSDKARFLKKQEAKRLLSSLGIKTPLSKIPLFGNISFQCY